MAMAGKALLTIAIFFIPLVSAICEQQRIPVQVWCAGDDGLTLRLRDAVEHAFATSSDFQLGGGKNRDTLIVTIPTNVGWHRMGKKVRVVYQVDISTAEGKILEQRHGSCFEDALQKCASSIVQASSEAMHIDNKL